MKTKPTPRERRNVMLATPFSEAYLKKINTLFVQPKLNGLRCLATLFPSQICPGCYCVRLESSTGIQFTFSATRNIQEQLLDFTVKTFHENEEIVFDGEIYNHSLSFQKISGLARRINSSYESSSQLQFHIFDIKDLNKPFAYRLHILNSFKDLLLSYKNIRLVRTAEIEKRNIPYNLEQAVSDGYEGLILRDGTSHYEEKRSKRMLKIKPDFSDFYQIKTVTQAINKTYDPLPRLGAFVCQDPDGTTFNIGPGKLSHSELAILWRVKDFLTNKWVKVLYLGSTEAGKPVSGRAISIHWKENGPAIDIQNIEKENENEIQ